MNDGKKRASATPRFGVAIWILLNFLAVLWIRDEVLDLVERDGQPGDDGPQLRVVAHSPDDDESADEADRLTFVFNRDLATEKELGEPLPWEPFSIEPQPKPAGRWTWAKPAVLEYKLAQPLLPGNEFKVDANKDFVRWLGMPLRGNRSFNFSTSNLAVEYCRVHSQDHLLTKIDLEFNHAVEPQAVRDNLICQENGVQEKMSWELLTPFQGKRFQVSVPTPRSRNLTVSLPKGFAGAHGPLGLKAVFQKSLRLGAAFAATSARPPYWRGTESRTTVKLRFNRNLDATQSVPRVRLTPSMDDLTVSINQNALQLVGTFDRGDGSYEAIVQDDVRSQDGEVLPGGARFIFTVPKRDPTVNFVHWKGFLSPHGNLSLDLKTAAVGNLLVSARKIYRNNLGSQLRRSWNGFPQKEVAKENFPIEREGDEVVKTTLDLASLLGKSSGVYRIRAEATDARWTSANAYVTVTDLGLTTKKSDKGVFVWVTSLSKASPVENAQVAVISERNQVIAEGKTDHQGIARFDAPVNHPDGQPWLVTAEKNEDLSYRLLDQRKWGLPDVAQDGRDAAESYDLFLYPERGVFRPGDVIRLTGILRDPLGNVPPEFPLEARVWQPDGRKVRSWPVNDFRDGIFHAEFSTTADGQTGPWRFAFGLPGASTAFAEIEVLVEAFEPVRVEAQAKATKPKFGTGEEHSAQLTSRYLFGQPAAHLPFVMRGGYFRVPFKSATYPHHRFTFLDGQSNRPARQLEDVTNEEGRSEIFLDHNLVKNLPGLWEGRFHATVTVPGGRSVSDRFTFQADPLGKHLGIAFPENFPPPTNESFEVSLVTVDSSDQPIASRETEVILERIERNWVLQEVDGSRVWRRQESFTPVLRKEIAGSPATKPVRSVSLHCPTSGSYRITAKDLLGGTLAQATFYVSSHRDETDPSLASPHRVTLKTDKEKYLPGEVAKVRVATPFVGNMLITLETDRPIVERVVMLEKTETVIDLPIPDTARGSAFLSASVIRPLDFDSPDWKPHRAYGLARLPIDHSSQRTTVSIEGPSKVEPMSEVTLQVKATLDPLAPKAAYVHLWAVDEGILLVSDHKTPDPGDHFFGPRRNMVDSGDLYLELLPDHKRPKSMNRTGAGGGRRGPPPLVKPQPRHPNVLWRTFAKLNPSGSYETTFKAPDFTGELRFMAVVVAGDNYGSTDHPLTVTSALLVEPSWPRFVAPGDHFRVPVKVFNTTDSPCSPKLSFTIDGPLSAKWETSNGLRIEPQEAKTLWLSCEATGLGVVHAAVQAQTKALQAEAKSFFVSRPPSTLQVERHFLELDAGEETAIAIPETILGETAKTTLTISPNPAIDLRPAVDRLMKYPHGCLEQTSSRLAPLLFAASLFDGSKAEYSRRMVDAGIRRLSSMQTTSGGLAYWPGDSNPYLWGTCYASLLMIEATQAGHELPDLDQEALATYLGQSLRADNPSLNQQAFLCRVLAAFGKPEIARQSFLLDRVDELDPAARAHLSAAWLASGRKDKAKRSLPDDTLRVEQAPRTTGGRLTSPVAQDGILLSTLLSLEPEHSWVSQLVDRLDQARKAGLWRSTLDDGLALSALCRYQAGVKQDPGDFSGTVRSGDLQERSFTSESSTDFAFEGSQPIHLTSHGTGPLYLSVRTEGLAIANQVSERDNGIVARRRWLDSEGKVLRDWTIDGPEETFPKVRLKVGDLVRVEIRLSTRGRGTIRNVAIVDSLPGGMEVENPRLATSANPANQTASEPDRVEFLDDRVVLFASAKGRADTFSYSMRATTQGEFSVPPVQATCMYDSSLNSLHGSGQLEIKPMR